jgi:hypothetical protein
VIKTSYVIKSYLIATLGMKMNKRMKQIQIFNNQLDKGINVFTIKFRQGLTSFGMKHINDKIWSKIKQI